MKFTLLGTGTSQGIPVIGCKCTACISTDNRDNRLRCSAYVHHEDRGVLIDAGPDFRFQALSNNLETIDAVLLTHEHNDHVAGLDDLRPFIFRRGAPMKIYAEERVISELRLRYNYAFTPQPYPGAPSFETHIIQPGQVMKFGKISIRAIRVFHGQLPILAFIIQDQVAYLTDTNCIPADSELLLSNIDILILDALRQRKHHSHFNLQEAIDNAASIRANKTFFIHMSHLMGPTKKWESLLPKNIFPSYDGQSFDLQLD